MNLLAELTHSEQFLLRCLTQISDADGPRFEHPFRAEEYEYCKARKILSYYSAYNARNVLPLPEPVAAEIAAIGEEFTRTNALRIQEAHRLQQILAEHGIESLLIKGLATCHYVYGGDLTARSYGDFDLFVHPDNAPDAYRILQKEAGYEVRDAQARQTLYARSVQHYAPLHAGPFSIDLHFRLNQDAEPTCIHFQDVYADAQRVQLHGAELVVPSAPWNFVILAHHMWRHQALEFAFNPRQFAEVYRLVCSPLLWVHRDALRKICEATRLDISLYYCICQCNRVCQRLYGVPATDAATADLFKSPRSEAVDLLRYRKLLTFESFGSWPAIVPYEKRLLRVNHDTDPDVHAFIANMFLKYHIETAWRKECAQLGIEFSEDMIPGKNYDFLNPDPS